MNLNDIIPPPLGFVYNSSGWSQNIGGAAEVSLFNDAYTTDKNVTEWLTKTKYGSLKLSLCAM